MSEKISRRDFFKYSVASAATLLYACNKKEAPDALSNIISSEVKRIFEIDMSSHQGKTKSDLTKYYEEKYDFDPRDSLGNAMKFEDAFYGAIAAFEENGRNLPDYKTHRNVSSTEFLASIRALEANGVINGVPGFTNEDIPKLKKTTMRGAREAFTTLNIMYYQMPNK